MAAPTATITPTFSWEKTQGQVKPLKKKQNPLMLIAGAAMVLLCLSGIWRMMHQTPSHQMVNVLCTKADIPAGSRLGFMGLRYMEIPQQYATSDMMTSLNATSDCVTRTFIQANEPIRSSMLFTGHKGLSLNIDTQERAMTLELNDDAMVDHQIAPDDVVDILAISTRDGKKYTKTICQTVRVLMATPKDQLLAKRTNGNQADKITLAVSPDAAELISEAAEVGKIRLVLRNRLSRTQQTLSGIEPDDLLPASALRNANQVATTAKKEQAVAVTLPPPPLVQLQEDPLNWMVEMIFGNHKEHVSVPVE